MKPTHYLQSLIYSLTKAERRYFKIFANFQSSKKQYLLLYDAMVKRKSPNDSNLSEEEFKIKLKDDIPMKQYPVIKNYLFEQIIASLRMFHAKSSKNEEVFGLIMHADLLKSKGFESFAIKKLDKAKLIAERYEFYNHLILIFDKKILISLNKGQGLETEINHLYEEKERFISILQLESKYKRCLHEAFLLYRKGKRARTEEDIKKINYLLENQLLLTPSRAPTFQSKIAVFYALAILHKLQNINPKQSGFYFNKILKVWMDYPHMKEMDQTLYKIHIYNFLNHAHSINDYSQFDNYLEEVSKIKPKNVDQQIEDFQNVNHLRLLQYLNTGEYKKAKIIAQEIDKQINVFNQQKLELKLARKITLFYNISILYFITKDFDLSLKFLQKILLIKGIEHRLDMQSFTRILSLIINYEMSTTHEYFKHLKGSTEYLLKKEKRYFDFEKLLVKYLDKLMKSIVNGKRREIFNSLKEDIIGMESKYPDLHILGLKEIKIWIESHLTDKSMTEILEEKGNN